MLANGFRHLPIVEGERAIGIISIRAVLRDATEN
jgi:CBS domain-containing protein